jgi:3'-phosphoadenosine 5'-phosphosulfate (PAPS) 3'-phosphatase
LLPQGYQYSWCVDPLDGTKEFIKRNGQFTVNIALLRGSQPILGVVQVPAQVGAPLEGQAQAPFHWGSKARVYRICIERVQQASGWKQARVAAVLICFPN